MLKLEIEGMNQQEAYELLHEALEARRISLSARVTEIESQLSEKPVKRAPYLGESVRKAVSSPDGRQKRAAAAPAAQTAAR